AARAGYDPASGKCTAWTATDGGIAVASGGSAGCTLADDGAWKVSSQGLHTLGSFGLVGISYPCPAGGRGCNALYVASGDNGPGARALDGTGHPLGGCGDSGNVLSDPGLFKPRLLATDRNGALEVYRSGLANLDSPTATIAVPPVVNSDWGNHVIRDSNW